MVPLYFSFLGKRVATWPAAKSQFLAPPRPLSTTREKSQKQQYGVAAELAHTSSSRAAGHSGRGDHHYPCAAHPGTRAGPCRPAETPKIPPLHRSAFNALRRRASTCPPIHPRHPAPRSPPWTALVWRRRGSCLGSRFLRMALHTDRRI